VVAAAAKDVWQSATGGAGANGAGGNNLVGPVVRPAACTPDTRVGTYGSSVGLVGGDPASSPGAGGGRTSAWSLGSSNACSLSSSAAQPSVAVHQQPSNHTFYPWMAIAGQSLQPLCIEARGSSPLCLP
jgi:Antp family protein